MKKMMFEPNSINMKNVHSHQLAKPHRVSHDQNDVNNEAAC